MKPDRNTAHINPPDNSWPPPPILQHLSLMATKPKPGMSTTFGLVSLSLAFLGEISATFLANTLSIYGQNWYESMHTFRMIGVLLFAIALVIGLLSWRSLAGKIGVCISFILLSATIVAYHVTGA